MDRREAIDILVGVIATNSEEENEALDLAIEALKGDLHCPKCGTIVRDGRQYHDLVYRGEAEKHQLSGETSTISENESVEGVAESATTTDVSGEEVDYCNNCPYISWSEGCNICRQQVIDAIEGVDWYHVNSKGELVHGSTSDEESWYRAEDIYKAIESLPPVTPTVSEDCISKAFALEVISDYVNYPTEGDKTCAIKNAPSVTPTERTGEWVGREHCQVDEDAYDVATCSNCKTEITLEYPCDNYCPNCGAKMGGDTEWMMTD